MDKSEWTVPVEACSTLVQVEHEERCQYSVCDGIHAQAEVDHDLRLGVDVEVNNNVTVVLTRSVREFSMVIQFSAPILR